MILYDAGLRVERRNIIDDPLNVLTKTTYGQFISCAGRTSSEEKSFFILTVITRFSFCFQTFILATCGSSSMPKKRAETSKPFTIVETIFFALFSRPWHSATSSSNPFMKFGFFSAVKIKEIALPSLTRKRFRETGTKRNFPIHIFTC